MPKNILIIAAEDSSAHYAEQLIKQIKILKGNNYSFWGVGSEPMQALGFEALSSPRQMAVVGLVEVIKHYRFLKKIFNLILARCYQSKPDVVLLMDYPGFNLRLAKALKPLGVKVIYWIPPQVWAWKKNRVFDLQKYVDQVICVFPFEVEFLKKHQVASTYFGHPLVDDLTPTFFDVVARRQRRVKTGLDPEKKVVGLMPGSRFSEIDKHLPILLEAAQLIFKKNKEVIFLLPVAPSIEIADIKARLEHLDVPLVIQKRNPWDVIDLMDTALVASGTATLLVALLEKPMVILYKMNSLTAKLLKFWVKGVSYFGLPNLIAQNKIVPELFQEQATAEELARPIINWLQDPVDYQKTVSELHLLRAQLSGEQLVIKQVADLITHF